MDDKDVKIAKLRAALAVAPRPAVTLTPEWTVKYMDWFFQHWVSMLNETEPR